MIKNERAKKNINQLLCSFLLWKWFFLFGLPYGFFYNMLFVILSGHDQINCQFLNHMFRLQIPCHGISWETTEYILRYSSSLIKNMPQRSHIREGCFPLHYSNLRRKSKMSREGGQDDRKPISVLACVLLSRAHPYFFLIKKHCATQRTFSYDQITRSNIKSNFWTF